MKIRASIGTAAVLGLEEIITEAQPTTAYLMQYSEAHCQSNCAFCPQARNCTGATDRLSRILWPVYRLETIVEALKTIDTGIRRICIQTVRFQGSEEELFKVLEVFNKSELKLPLTVCSYPMSRTLFQKMKSLGVSRVGVAFDCATPELFAKIKGKERGVTLSWEQIEQALIEAIRVFGRRFVTTHLIIGLGETEEEAIKFIQTFHDKGITIGLFAFTPIKGTALASRSQPALTSYRRIQLARYLIVHELSSYSQMTYEMKGARKGKIKDFGVTSAQIEKAIISGKPFKTSGCPYCNRPFYNESPGKELYNYPWEPTVKEITQIQEELKEFLR
ncbi:MAG: radical SAM protein [Candidatus Heimdallarchaeota archaeon]|nr:radical SAM protein [Candidatus Heimdallarchaeota archaeon]